MGKLIDADELLRLTANAEPDGFENCYNCTCLTSSEVKGIVDEMPDKSQMWIPVSERLPETYHSVLVYCPDYKNTITVWYNGEEWLIAGTYGLEIEERISHWMPLPQPPIEGDV